uniref:Uncharacterized protein n=1 Tax=Glossina palpalis gambiensis TaxID=67801 RepID=A0A1B0AU51_9MUSC
MRYDVRSRRNIESIIRFRSTRKYLSSTTYLGLRSQVPKGNGYKWNKSLKFRERWLDAEFIRAVHIEISYSVIVTVTTFCKQRSTKMTAIDMKFYYNICSRWLVECLILFITNIFRVLTKVNAFAAKYQCVKFCLNEVKTTLVFLLKSPLKVEMLSYK